MNWDKKLIIAMASFMIFIMILGAVMIIRNESDTLIEDDYYEKGQTYNIDYQAKQNAIEDKITPAIDIKKLGVIITFSYPVKYLLICRRPSDYHLDRPFSGYTDKNRSIQIYKGQLEPGPWLLRIQYIANEKNYLYETKIKMP